MNSHGCWLHNLKSSQVGNIFFFFFWNCFHRLLVVEAPLMQASEFCRHWHWTLGSCILHLSFRCCSYLLSCTFYNFFDFPFFQSLLRNVASRFPRWKVFNSCPRRPPRPQTSLRARLAVARNWFLQTDASQPAGDSCKPHHLCMAKLLSLCFIAYIIFVIFAVCMIGYSALACG